MNRDDAVLFFKSSRFYPGGTSVQMPVGLKHLESAICWCDPVIELGEHGQEELLHRQVTWN